MTLYDPAAACFYAVPALLWAVIAQEAWWFRFGFRPRNVLYRLLPFATTSMMIFYALFAAIELFLPGTSMARAPRWFDLTDVALASSLALFRHMAWHFPLDAKAPTKTWLAVNYLAAAVVGVTNLFPEVVPASSIEMQITIARTLVMPFVMLMLALSVWRLRRFARPGGWRVGSTVARGADVVVVTLALLAAATVFSFYALFSGPDPRVGYINPPALLNAGIGVLVAVPFAVRNLGEVLKRLSFLVAILVTTAVFTLATQRVAARLAPDAAALLWFAAAAVFVLLLLGVRSSLWAAIEHVLFRRSHRRRDELQRFIYTLSPELGAVECCRRAAAEFVRTMGLRGIAVLLTRDRGVAVAGDVDVEPLRRVWGDGAIIDTLPQSPFSIGTFRELPLPVQEALIESEVFGMLLVSSPRQHWGAAFATASPLQAGISIEDQQAVQGLADQLALVLDASELLSRAVSVERSLAHAEKLAALGELSARIAHEIRNPAAAAKSLAQQLAREPASPFREEHELILKEIERIERQVSALLRFARRDELDLQTFDLGALAGSTLQACRPRLAAGRIDVALSAAPVRVRADAEKLRQVLINLIENAADALSEGVPERRISVAVAREGARARIRVSDTGRGVAPEAMDRLFEPFFSSKPHGTGLGLAIVKRTVEAHGGTIRASTGSGMTFDIELPVVEESAAWLEQTREPTDAGGQ